MPLINSMSLNAAVYEWSQRTLLEKLMLTWQLKRSRKRHRYLQCRKNEEQRTITSSVYHMS